MRSSALFQVGMFTVTYVLIATYFALKTGNWEFVFYIATILVFIGLTIAVYRKIPLSSVSVWGLSIWGLMHMLGGLMPVPSSWPINGARNVLYSLWIIPDFLKYDHVVHAFGFGMCTVVVAECLAAIMDTKHLGRGAVIISVLAALGLGAINELLEFVAVLTIPDTNVGGYVNTGWDLAANAAGALIAAFIVTRRYRHATNS